MGPAGKDGGSVVAGPASSKIDSLEALSKYFVMPEKQVAKELGICLTSLKKLCRQYGVTRWPYRKVGSAALIGRHRGAARMAGSC